VASSSTINPHLAGSQSARQHQPKFHFRALSQVQAAAAAASAATARGSATAHSPAMHSPLHSPGYDAHRTNLRIRDDWATPLAASVFSSARMAAQQSALSRTAPLTSPSPNYSSHSPATVAPLYPHGGAPVILAARGGRAAAMHAAAVAAAEAAAAAAAAAGPATPEPLQPQQRSGLNSHRSSLLSSAKGGLFRGQEESKDAAFPLQPQQQQPQGSDSHLATTFHILFEMVFEHLFRTFCLKPTFRTRFRTNCSKRPFEQPFEHKAIRTVFRTAFRTSIDSNTLFERSAA